MSQRAEAASTAEYRYSHLRWPQINDVVRQERVVLLPTGATEQHGRHLPLDTDAFLAEAVCLEAGRRRPEQLLVLPPLAYGLNLHHIDFPGTIHIEPEHFIAFCLDIVKSVTHHGLRKVLIVNGHGSNDPLIDIVARKAVLGTDALCAAVSYYDLATEAIEKVCETAVLAHADELETSLYLHLAPDRVRMDETVAGDDVRGRFLSSDSTTAVRFNDIWGRWTTTGVHGDPRPATPEKGRVIFEAAVNGLVGLVKEWQDWPIAERIEQHTRPPSTAVPTREQDT